MRRSLAGIATFALASAASVIGVAHAAPVEISERAITVEQKGADVKNVFALLSQVGGRKVVLDPCVKGTLDVRFVNVSPALAFDALARKLSLTYEDRGPDVIVRCERDPRLDTRISLDVREMDLQEVLQKIVAIAHLDGMEYLVPGHPTTKLTLDRVRVANVLAALSDQTGLRISLSGGKIVVLEAL